jgi:hypothetical protein
MVLSSSINISANICVINHFAETMGIFWFGRVGSARELGEPRNDGRTGTGWFDRYGLVASYPLGGFWSTQIKFDRTV